MPRFLRNAGWLLPLASAACALSAPPAETILDATPPGGDTTDETLPLAERAQLLQQELDAQAATTLAATRQAPDDAALALAAARVLFQAADLRLQRASLALLDAEPAPTLADVLTADDRVTDPARMEILSLCTAGLEAAGRAGRSRPDDVGARLHEGLHLSLIAWANGPARSLFAGYGPRLVRAIDAALAIDAEADDGAPLRLQGRFRGKAPWPYGDLELAKTSLARAVGRSPDVINLLFLGDVLFAGDDRDGARARWQAATTAPADASIQWSAPVLRELARRRLEALAREQDPQ